jgi:hypothetical protein
MGIRHSYRYAQKSFYGFSMWSLFFLIMIALAGYISPSPKLLAFSAESTKVRSEASYTEPSSTVVIHNVALREQLLAWIGQSFPDGHVRATPPEY